MEPAELVGHLLEREWTRNVRDDLAAIRHDFDACVQDGDKEAVEWLYGEVYELREYMNRVHASTVWRTPK